MSEYLVARLPFWNPVREAEESRIMVISRVDDDDFGSFYEHYATFTSYSKAFAAAKALNAAESLGLIDNEGNDDDFDYS